jgi:hypothetical protein
MRAFVAGRLRDDLHRWYLERDKTRIFCEEMSGTDHSSSFGFIRRKIITPIKARSMTIIATMTHVLLKKSIESSLSITG